MNLEEAVERSSRLGHHWVNRVSVAPQGDSVIQRALTVISMGLLDRKWVALRNLVIQWNKGRKGLFIDLRTLKELQLHAVQWQQGDFESQRKKDQQPKTNDEIDKLLKEIITEQDGLLKTSPLLSEVAVAINKELHLLGDAEAARMQALGTVVGDASYIIGEFPPLTPVREIYVLKAFAAGRSPKEVYTFLQDLDSTKDGAIVDLLDLTPIGKTGPRQQYADFCSSASVQIFEARFDPIVALELSKQNKDITERMDEKEVKGLHDPKWLKKMLQEKASTDNNVDMLKKQNEIATKYSTDKSGRLGLSPEDRTKAFNDLALKTGIRYQKITTAGLQILKVYKKVESSDKSSEEEVPKRELEREIKTATFPTKERMVPASKLIRMALQYGAPVGVGVGGHAELFVDFQGSKFILFEPSFGSVQQVDESDIKNGTTGSDPIANLILPVDIGSKEYTKTLKVLEKLGEAKDTVLETE